MIQAAQNRGLHVVRQTPLLSSPLLDDIAGRPIFAKAEVLQHTGSFKFRGAWSALTSLNDAVRKTGIVAYSSGNHAQGVARAAQILGVRATIIMPQNAPALKINNTRAYGANVVLYDRRTESREDIGARLQHEQGLHLIRPFDDPFVIAGQGTCGLEIAQQAQEAGLDGATVLTCCGGGGLTAGIALALENKPGFTVRPVEPVGFDDARRSLAQGKILRNHGPEIGLWDAVLTPQPGHVTFPVMQALCGPGLVVSADETLAAMRLAFECLKLCVEPGGAVALAAALFHGHELDQGPVICTLSGGNVTPDVMMQALQHDTMP
jgi:threonine dehydratase